MPLALVRTDPLERLLSEIRDRLTTEDHAELRRRFERRRRMVWYRVVGRALRRASETGRIAVRARARAFPRSPRDDLDLSLRRIGRARAGAALDERRIVTRRCVRAEFHRLVGGMDESIVDTVVDVVTRSFYRHLH